MKTLSEFSGIERQAMVKAIEMKARAYSPYSNFRVGCAALCANDSGAEQLFLGCNVENASFGLTICAERVAICNAVSNSFTKLKLVVVAADADKVSPCGACLQFTREFSKDVPIMLVDQHENVHEMNLNQCIPFAFGPEVLLNEMGQDKVAGFVEKQGAAGQKSAE